MPSTNLNASFQSWDAASRRVTLSVSVNNNGQHALFAPIKAVITSLSSPATQAVNPDAGTGAGSWAWLYDADPLLPASNTESLPWILQSPVAADFQLEVSLLASVPVPAGQGVTITAADGSCITVPPGALPYDALVDIEMVPPSQLAAPIGSLGLAGVVNVTFEPSLFSATFDAPSQPFQISIPTSLTATGTTFLVAEQVVIDSIVSTRTATPPTPQLFPISTAVLTGVRIAPAPPPPGTTLMGVKSAGLGFCCRTRRVKENEFPAVDSSYP